jgi:acyl carrier protein
MTDDTLLALIARTLGIDRAQVTEASDMSNTPKWDSLRQIMLMTELETHYGIELTDQEMLESVSVSQIQTVLTRYGVG